MSAITPDAVNPLDDQDRLHDDEKRHELLCAYLLDELEEDERRKVETALAASEELAGERDRLAATIGVVQNAFPPEGLSPEALAELMSKATAGPSSSVPPGWSFLRGGGGMLRVAAALVVLVGGWFAARWYLEQDSTPATPDTVAKNELGYDVEGGTDAAEARPHRRTWGEEKGIADSPFAGEVATTERGAGARGVSLREAQDVLTDLGYAADAPDQTVEDLTIRLGDEASRALTAKDEESPSIGLLRVTVDTQPSSTAGGVEFEAMEEAAETTTALQLHAGANPPRVNSTGGYAGPSSPVPPGTASTPGRKADTSRNRPGSDRYFLGRSQTAQPPGEAVPDPASDLPARPEQLYKKQLGEALARYRFYADDQAGAELGAALRGLGYSGEEADGDADGVELLRLAFDFEGPDIDTLRLRDTDKAGRGRRLVLTPQEIDEVADVVLEGCRIQAGETPSAMFYRFWGDNPFEPTAVDHQSTFAADVDTASYTLARRYLNGGVLPTRQQIRTEEFVNYFAADQPAPVGGDVFALFVEMAPSLFNSDPAVEMLRVTVRGKDVDRAERQPLALTFVVDVSGSMDDGGRLELVKHALGLLVRELDANDAIALVKFSKTAQVVSPMVSALNRGPFEDELAKLDADGGTNIEAGLVTGYELASHALTAHAVNRVILLSDGVGNIGETDQERIVAQVEEHREKGIYLNTIGVGMGNHNDVFLEQLADKGDGVCNFVDSEKEAEKVMVDDFTKTLQPIARDVKIQVEFDPAQVESYRQLGYENRAIADAQFRDDAVDAGEVNAGHQVTCLYEVKRLPAPADTGIPLARVNLRYKPQRPIDAGDTSAAGYEWAETATEKNKSFFAREAASSFSGTGAGYRRAVLVAQFAEFLRRSIHAAEDSFDELVAGAKRLNEELDDPEFAEFYGLLQKAGPLFERARPGEPEELFEAMEELRRRQYELNRDAQRLERQLESGADSFRAETKWIDLGVEAQEELTRLEGEVRRLIQSNLTPPPAAAEADETKGTVR